MPEAALVGQTIARYRIVEKLGSGGMGEVFRAIDNVLQRPVALKILPPEVIQDEMRLRRFILEAQTASALNHPNIVTIHDVGNAVVENSDGTSQTVHYIAMELIEGVTLAKRIYSRAPLKTLLELMHGVADALANAHSAGILHRDLKPDNIMVTTEGRAKVVDFGLAKLIHGDAKIETEGPTVERTREGMMLGTVGYMSPEQIAGKAIDGRSDIFSFGCVLYEATCRKRPFAGQDAIDTLHKIQRSAHSPASAIDPALPAAIDRITNRCLAKDPEDRYQSMKEVEVELRLLLRELQSPEAAATSPRPRRRHRWWIAASGAGAVIAAVIIAGLMPVAEPDFSTYRFTPLETAPEYQGSPAFSPDGRSVAYLTDVNGILQVFTRSLDVMRGAQLTHSLEDCRDPFWSPDGSQIYYISIAGDRDSLWSIGAGGGTARLILENVSAAALSPDARTLALMREGDAPRGSSLRLWLASPPTTPPRQFLTGEFARRTSQTATLHFSPDGSVLGAWLMVGNITGAPREFWLIDTKRLSAKKVLPSLSDVPQAYPFSWMPDSRRIVFSGVHGAKQSAEVHLWIADTSSDQVRALTSSSSSEASPTVSPDGKRIVFASLALDFDLATIPVAAPQLHTLLSTARSERAPVWSPSGSGFAYVTNRGGTDEIWFRSAAGDFERPIATNKDFNDGAPSDLLFGLSFSPDGQRMAYTRQGTQRRAWISPVAGGPALPLDDQLLSRPGKGQFDSPTWSSDGSSVAFIERLPARLRLAKFQLGVDAQPIPLLDDITLPITRWSPTGQWITASTAHGFFLVSADGAIKRKISDGHWLVHTWSSDGTLIYGIRIDDDLHLLLSRLAVDGKEHVMADLGISPPAVMPLDGFSLSADGKTFITSLLKPKGDLWMLEGFDEPQPPRWRRWLRAL